MSECIEEQNNTSAQRETENDSSKEINLVELIKTKTDLTYEKLMGKFKKELIQAEKAINNL